MLLLAAAAPASALTRKQAGKRAVAALGASKASGPVVVFGLPKKVAAGTKVTQQGKSKVLARAGSNGAFFFYKDGAPFTAFPHPGRVALVDAKTGKVKLTKVLTRKPLLNGRLPAFLKSTSAYRDDDYVVYESNTQTTDAPTTTTAEPEPSFLAVDVPGVNQPPEGDDQFVTAKFNSPKHITLTGADPDLSDGEETPSELLTYTISKPPNKGTISGQPPNITYTPQPGWLGPDHFFFTVSDGELTSKEAKVTISVVPLGAPPTVTASAGCTAYSELTAAVAVDPGLTVSDPDDTVLDSAAVRIVNFEGGDDLGFTDQNGITGSFSDNTGVLTLVGDASLATYQAALRTVTYRNLANGSPSPTKDIQFTVNDAGNNSAAATKQVCITESGGPNDRPIGEIGTEGALSYIENDGPLSIDAAFWIVDDDSTHLSGATVKFTVSQPPLDDDGNPIGDPVNNYREGEDVLAFTDQNGITGSFDSSLGVLTLSGSATVAAYEAAIRSVTYENTSEDPFDGARTVRFQVTDSSGLNSVPSNQGILITPVNDAPEVDTSDGNSSYTEDEPAVPVDAALDSIDVDDEDLEGAKVRISAGLQSGDELIFVDQAGISGTYNTGTGELTLTGTASVADYQTALRSIEFRHVGDDPDPSRTVEFVTNDGELDSVPATKDITVIPVNDKPVLSATAGSTAYTENDAGVVVDSSVSASDVDSDTFAGATVSVSGNFVAGDTLGFADQNGISGNYDSETGVLTLTGSASIADYETALRSVTFSSSSDNPTDATRTVSFVADDGGSTDNLSDAVTRDVTVTPVNDAPAVNTSAGTTSYTENDAGVAVDADLSSSDVDDDNLEGAVVRISSGFEAGDDLFFVNQNGISGVYSTGTGVLTLSGSASEADYETALRSIEFSSTSDNPGPSRTVEFVTNDGELDSAAATKDIAITAVNDKPVLSATAGSASYTEGGAAVVVDSGVSASDVDSTTFAGATVTISGNYTGGDTLGFVEQNGISGGFDSETGVLTLSGNASISDYETALRSVTFESTSDNPTGATRTISFVADDGGSTDNLSDAVSRDVSVTPVNDAPVVATSEGSTEYPVGDPGVAVDGNVAVDDADDSSIESATVSIGAGFEAGDELVYVNQLGITGVYNTVTGVLTLIGSAPESDYDTALRSIEFRHTGGTPSGTRTVEFKASDGDADSATATKTISIVEPPANTAPFVTTSEGSTTYTLGDTSGVEADPGVLVTDDGATLTGGQVQVDGFEPGDELVYVDQLGISGVFNTGTGVLVLTGSASVADYETALRSIKFRHTGDNQSSFRTIAFKVNDGEFDSAFGLKSLQLVAPE